MSRIKITCPYCLKEMEGEEEWIGWEAVCPFCQKNFVINLAPVRPTLGRPAVPGPPQVSQSAESSGPAVPPGSGKKIVLLTAGGAVILLLAAVGVWIALPGRAAVPGKRSSEAAKTAPPVPGKRSAKTAPSVLEKRSSEAAKTAPSAPRQIVPAAYKPDSEFDISHLVSGLPRAKKPDKPFRIEDFSEYLTTPELQKRRREITLQNWQNAAEAVMSISVRNGLVHDIHALLELGYDINGLYPLHERASEKRPLLVYLPSPVLKNGKIEPGSKEKFLRTFLFLVENGIDCQRETDGKDITYMLVNLCSRIDDPELWRLIPYVIAHGVNFKRHTVLGINNKKLRDYVSRAMVNKLSPPQPVGELRLTSFAETDKEMKEAKSPLLNSILAFNPEIYFFSCSYRRKRTPFTVDRIGELFRRGIHPNAVMLCTGHGGGIIKDGPLGERCEKKDTRALAFLLANGWRFGMERTASDWQYAYGGPKIDHERRLLLWEYGASVSVYELRNVRYKEDYDFLLSLYRKQCFKLETVTLRKETYWNYLAALEAVFQNDLPALRKLVENGVDINYSDDELRPLIFTACRGDKDKKEVANFLLEQGADPNAGGKKFNGRSPFDLAVESGRIEVAELLHNTGKLPKPDPASEKCTCVCELIQKLLHSRVSGSAWENRVKTLTFVTDKAGYPLHAACKNYPPDAIFNELIRNLSEYSFTERRRRLFCEWLLARGFKPSAKAVDEAIAKEKKRRRHRNNKPNEYLTYLEQLKQSGKVTP